MATISEIKWYQVTEGECPYCHRDRPLGRLNVVGADELRCIDCYFGPPIEYWLPCPKCGLLQPGDNCSDCGAKIY